MEDSLELEKKQLDVEQQWEILRSKREKEAEEEMKEQIRKKEEALLEELKRLVEEKESKDTENNDLRKQLKVKPEVLYNLLIEFVNLTLIFTLICLYLPKLTWLHTRYSGISFNFLFGNMYTDKIT